MDIPKLTMDFPMAYIVSLYMGFFDGRYGLHRRVDCQISCCTGGFLFYDIYAKARCNTVSTAHTAICSKMGKNYIMLDIT